MAESWEVSEDGRVYTFSIRPGMGTDWPGSDFELERLKIAKSIPEAERPMVEGGTLARLLGLSA